MTVVNPQPRGRSRRTGPTRVGSFTAAPSPETPTTSAATSSGLTKLTVLELEAVAVEEEEVCLGSALEVGGPEVAEVEEE